MGEDGGEGEGFLFDFLNNNALTRISQSDIFTCQFKQEAQMAVLMTLEWQTYDPKFGECCYCYSENIDSYPGPNFVFCFRGDDGSELVFRQRSTQSNTISLPGGNCVVPVMLNTVDSGDANALHLRAINLMGSLGWKIKVQN